MQSSALPYASPGTVRNFSKSRIKEEMLDKLTYPVNIAYQDGINRIGMRNVALQAVQHNKYTQRGNGYVFVNGAWASIYDKSYPLHPDLLADHIANEQFRDAYLGYGLYVEHAITQFLQLSLRRTDALLFFPEAAHKIVEGAWDTANFVAEGQNIEESKILELKTKCQKGLDAIADLATVSLIL